MVVEEKEHTEGDVIADKFRVIRKLGKGGMGAVYEAEHVLTQKRVALKVMLGFADDNEMVKQRFLREARAACAIRHPAIVPVHDLIPLGDRLILVMDLLEGRTLFDIQEANPGRRIHPLLAVEYMLPIVSALGALHAAGFIHRDIKPENIFVTEQGSFLLDLGIVKDTRGPTTTRLTTDGGIGTPLYMSPEQAFNKPFDHRVDVWSLGLVMYESFAGDVPTMAGSMGAIYQLIGAANFRPLAEVVPGVPPTIAKLVDAMISGEPELRPPSMRDVYETLAAHASSALVGRYACPEDPSSVARDSETFKRKTVADPAKASARLELTNSSVVSEGVTASTANGPISVPAFARLSATHEAPPMTTPTALVKTGKSRVAYLLLVLVALGLAGTIGVIGLQLARGKTSQGQAATTPPPPTAEPTDTVATAPATESAAIVDPTVTASDTATAEVSVSVSSAGRLVTTRGTGRLPTAKTSTPTTATAQATPPVTTQPTSTTPTTTSSVKIYFDPKKKTP